MYDNCTTVVGVSMSCVEHKEIEKELFVVVTLPTTSLAASAASWDITTEEEVSRVPSGLRGSVSIARWIKPWLKLEERGAGGKGREGRKT